MGNYNIVNQAALAAGQPEDISVVLANLQAIQTVLNGNIEDVNIKAAAAIAISKLAGYPTDGAKALFGDGTWKATGGRSTAAVAAANVDVAAPTTTLVMLTGAGGNIRSLGAGSVGQRVTFEVQGAAVTLSNQLGGGAGAQLVNRGQRDVTLQTFESIEYVYNVDGAWYEVTRDITQLAGSMYRNAAGQLIAHNTTTTITFTTVEFDPGGYLDLAGNRILIPAGKGGLYWVHGNIMWAANAAGIRIAQIIVNGAVMGESAIPGGVAADNVFCQVGRVLSLVAGDVILLKGYQDSGGNLVAGGDNSPYADFFSFIKLM